MKQLINIQQTGVDLSSTNETFLQINSTNIYYPFPEMVTTPYNLNIGVLATSVDATTTLTVRAYLGYRIAGDGTKYFKILESTMAKNIDAGTKSRRIYLTTTPLFVIRLGALTQHLYISLQADNSSTSACTANVFVYDTKAGLDISYVNGETPYTPQDISDIVKSDIISPSDGGATIYPIKVNPDGSVKTKGGLAR